MSMAMFDSHEQTMSWIGWRVNGASRSPRSSERRTLLLRGGLLGNALPRLQLAVVPVSDGDTLILTTDGVRAGIDDRFLQGRPCKPLPNRFWYVIAAVATMPWRWLRDIEVRSDDRGTT